MKFREIFRFELIYQMRRPWTWLFMAVMIVFAFLSTRIAIVPVTLPQDFILNSPFIIAAVSVFSCQIWLLLAPSVAGEAAARDVQTGMHPLTYTSRVTKAQYLAGRFLAAFVLNAIILAGVQVGSLLAAYGTGADPEIIGPFRPTAYIAAYAFIGLTNALIATTFQFAAALVTSRPMASYLGSLILFFLSYPLTFALYIAGFGNRALMADPIGIMAIMNEMMSNWTIVEKNVRMFTLEGAMLWNRLLWLGIALCTLMLIYMRFRFSHRIPGDLLSRLARLLTATKIQSPNTFTSSPGAISVPFVRQSFSFRTHLRQVIAIARSSFLMIATSPGGLFLLIAFPILLTFVVLVESQHWGVPLLPRTPHLLVKHLTGILTAPNNYWVMVPLFIIYFAGELVWRERDAGLSETVDATPVQEWVLFLGKFTGLGLILATLMTIIVLVGVTVQLISGYYDLQIGLYLQVLLGLQLTDYMLFGVLVFTVQALVNQKYIGHILALVVYMLMIFSSFIGIEHHLLVYASGPKWMFTDMRGWGSSLVPWLWFRLYWATWALLLALTAGLLWVRGNTSGFRERLNIVRLRLTRRMAGVAGVAVALVLIQAGFIFYNTNVLNEYITDNELVQRRAEYETKYGKYESIPQPQRTATKLHIEIYPDRHTATIRGSYHLVNPDTMPIDSVHLEPAFYVQTNMTFDRAAKVAVADHKLGHFIYVLDEPLQPGDSMMLNFDVQFEQRGFRSASGFRNSGAGIGIFQNGTYLTSGALPVIGYQALRELWSSDERRKHGLPRQVTLPAPADIDPHMAAQPPATFEAIIGTDADQIAIAPGRLRPSFEQTLFDNHRTEQGTSQHPSTGRHYFHYVSDVPIIGEQLFFSADYAVHRERWLPSTSSGSTSTSSLQQAQGQAEQAVDIQVYLHPRHREHMERLLRSVRASLEFYSQQFGPYPYHFLQIVEQPGNFFGMGVDGSGVVTGGESFFLLNPSGDGFDAIFEIVAHEIGHQWWGMQLKPAFAEGGGVISESLAWYSAMQLVKNTKGREALRRFMSFMRQPNPWPPIRTGLPLLRAMDPWANYRKGPYAMHALSEYVGEAKVNGALRALVGKKESSLTTTMDLYRELQMITPDSLKPLLHDLFAANTFWTFDTKQATAKQTEAGMWEVKFELEAHKVVTDSAGIENETPVNQWVEIGLFHAAERGEVLGRPLYVQKHFVVSGVQTINVTLRDKPTRGGIDPYNLLDWEEGDNIEAIIYEKTDTRWH